MEMLHRDTVENILCGLPIKNICKIRYVCKQWYAIISDHHFFKLHPQNNTQILTVNYTTFGGLRASSMDLKNKVTLDVFDIDFPLKFATMVGSCNGLVCLTLNNTLVFWNPFTNKYRTLRIPLDMDPYKCSFGYDSVHDDYKVVWLHSYRHFKIYSLKYNTWRSYDLGYKFDHNYQGIYLQGSLHYIGCDSDELTAFSLADEKLGGTLPEPDDFNANVRAISVLDDCFCIRREFDIPDAIEIWVMKEYMVKGSWSKLCAVSRNQIPSAIYIAPLCTSQHGHIMLEIGEADDNMLEFGRWKLLKYNMEHNSIVSTTKHYSKFSHIIPYVLSLVSPNYNNGH